MLGNKEKDMSRKRTPDAFEKYVEQNIVSVLREYADAAEAGGKRHWAKAMREAAKQLRSGIETAAKANGSTEDDLHVCGQCDGTGYVA